MPAVFEAVEVEPTWSRLSSPSVGARRGHWVHNRGFGLGNRSRIAIKDAQALVQKYRTPAMVSWLSQPMLSVALLSAFGTAHAASLSCTTGFVPLSISANNQRFNVSSFKTQLDVSNYFRETVIVGSNLTSEITLPGFNHINATYNIWTKTCIPKNWNGVVEVLVHG